MTSPVWAASETQGWEEMVKPGVSSADQEAGSPWDNRQSTLTTTLVHKPPIIEDCEGQYHILKDQRALLFLRDLAFHNKY